jgi:hypothetical protein
MNATIQATESTVVTVRHLILGAVAGLESRTNRLSLITASGSHDMVESSPAQCRSCGSGRPLHGAESIGSICIGDV